MIGKTVWIPSALLALALSGCGAALLAGTGAVVTHAVVQERSTMEVIEDTQIKLSLEQRLLSESAGLFADVAVDVVEGRVLMTGSVPRRGQKITATRIAWATPGVVSVADELTVAEDSGTMAYLEDAWISNRLRVTLLANDFISATNYNVETVDKVVYLTGLARSRTDLANVIDIAAGIPGVVKVVSYVLTIDDPRRRATPTGAQAGAQAAS